MKILSIALAILSGISIMAQEINLEEKWDKTFPKSEKVEHDKVILPPLKVVLN